MEIVGTKRERQGRVRHQASAPLGVLCEFQQSFAQHSDAYCRFHANSILSEDSRRAENLDGSTYRRIGSSPGQYTTFVQSDVHSINVLTAGTFVIKRPGKEERLLPGSVFVTRPGMEYRIDHSNSIDNDQCLSLYLSPESASDDVALMSIFAESQAVRLKMRSRMMYWSRCCANAIRSGDLAALEDRISALPSNLNDCPNLSLTGHVSSRQLSWYMERAEVVQHYITIRPGDDLRLGVLSRIVGMSPFHFSRVFHELTGVTPHKYVSDVRLRNAKKMLRDGASVTQAAVDNGFTSLSHFSRAFKRAFGRNPSSV